MEKASQAPKNVVKNFIVMSALNTTLRILLKVVKGPGRLWRALKSCGRPTMALE